MARKGMGKSGGARVVYIWRNERFPVFLITVFPKNEKENLSMPERNTLRKLRRCTPGGDYRSSQSTPSTFSSTPGNRTGFCPDCLHPGLTGVYRPFRGVFAEVFRLKVEGLLSEACKELLKRYG